MARKAPPPGPGKPKADQQGNGQPVAKDVELLRVLISRQGKKVSAQWALHPQLKQDLRPEELKEVSELMARVTTLVGAHFSQILSEAEPDKPGTA